MGKGGKDSKMNCVEEGSDSDVISLSLASPSGDHCAGVLFGLCAGDRNGGPVRLAIRLSKSLLEKESFCQTDVIEKYHNWFKGPPYDTEKAFDTGYTFYKVFKQHSSGISIEKAAESVQKKYGSVGVGPAHRASVISMAKFVNTKNLPSAVLQETGITHANKISYEVNLFCNLLCRELIQLKSWEKSIEIATSIASTSEVKQAIELSANCTKSDLTPDGYAPDVLTAALFFLHTENDFGSALNASILFAGPDNYCPVLVGAIGGARYGAKEILCGKATDLQTAIDNPFYKHCTKDLLREVFDISNKFASLW